MFVFWINLDGNVDWMNFNHAVELAPKMRQARVAVVHEAGHHLYLDNPDGFHQVILQELDESVEFVSENHLFKYVA